VTASANGQALTEHVLAGGGYLGSGEARLTFGLGDACEANVTVLSLDGTSRAAVLRAGEAW
jgi:hypothetical protein